MQQTTDSESVHNLSIYEKSDTFNEYRDSMDSLNESGNATIINSSISTLKLSKSITSNNTSNPTDSMISNNDDAKQDSSPNINKILKKNTNDKNKEKKNKKESKKIDKEKEKQMELEKNKNLQKTHILPTDILKGNKKFTKSKNRSIKKRQKNAFSVMDLSNIEFTAGVDYQQSKHKASKNPNMVRFSPISNSNSDSMIKPSAVKTRFNLFRRNNRSKSTNINTVNQVMNNFDFALSPAGLANRQFQSPSISSYNSSSPYLCGNRDEIVEDLQNRIASERFFNQTKLKSGLFKYSNRTSTSKLIYSKENDIQQHVLKFFSNDKYVFVCILKDKNSCNFYETMPQRCRTNKDKTQQVSFPDTLNIDFAKRDIEYQIDIYTLFTVPANLLNKSIFTKKSRSISTENLKTNNGFTQIGTATINLSNCQCDSYPIEKTTNSNILKSNIYLTFETLVYSNINYASDLNHLYNRDITNCTNKWVRGGGRIEEFSIVFKCNSNHLIENDKSRIELNLKDCVNTVVGNIDMARRYAFNLDINQNDTIQRETGELRKENFMLMENKHTPQKYYKQVRSTPYHKKENIAHRAASRVYFGERSKQVSQIDDSFEVINY
ncbi:hypothetical protein A3Q56_04806 [Intoshia linei]|uniref:Uncharacterized protein n=1 Tax=Intoshia linei TaxID=1819745 RepID=A0A177B1F2_9BILA|nr:hypothetical protein A3Q56_04806 [Intoshia linei]